MLCLGVTHKVEGDTAWRGKGEGGLGGGEAGGGGGEVGGGGGGGGGGLGGGYLEGQLIREWVLPSESVWRNQSVVGLTSGLHGSGGGNVGEKRRVVRGRAHCTLTCSSHTNKHRHTPLTSRSA